jgi:hypothetical protein
MPSAKSPISFPAGVPERARQRINALREAPPASDGIDDLLERLATYEVMRTDVWERLPSEPKEIQGDIVSWVVFAVLMFPRLTRPHPKKRSEFPEWLKHYQKYPPLPSGESISGLALALLESMHKVKTETDLCWDRLWEGDKSIKSDEVLAILDQLRLFYSRMDAESRAFLATLPKVKRWKGDKAKQKFFTEYLSECMRQTYGQPLDTIVAALAEVAFDLPQGIAAETVRGRRRTASTPENSD